MSKLTQGIYREGHVMSKFIKLTTAFLIASLLFLLPSATALHTTAYAFIENETDVVKDWLPKPVVIIDAGHGGVDGGAIYGGIYEKDINLKVAQKLYLLLQSENIPAILNRTGDYALSEENRWHRVKSRHLKDLSQRSGLTKQLNYAIFVSIHCNASPSPKAHGPLVLHQKTGESYLLASLLQHRLNNVFHTSKKAAGANSFYLLKYVNKPAVIVELGFISSWNDQQILTDQTKQTEIAQALSSGISHYLIINN